MNPQDVINVLIDQRNSAMNELALAKAQLIDAERKIKELLTPSEETGNAQTTA